MGIKRIIPALAGNTNRRVQPHQALSDHPRSRGEYLEFLSWDSFHVGSSPLSRGILADHAEALAAPGIIPALAGNTSIPSPGRWCGTDHPRSRGEYSSTAQSDFPLPGSSPLSRGIQRRGVSAGPRCRIIPALAGNTPPTCPPSAKPPDHPRSRGEYRATLCNMTRRSGSSPLSRGIPGQQVARHPAGVDHPRSRGEYHIPNHGSFAKAGSSPLSRGIPIDRGADSTDTGIIPALAGNTDSPRIRARTAWDHPRSRGEYIPPAVRPARPLGSSPLSRGILSTSAAVRNQAGIIPALAGNTWSRSRSSRPPRDHPRSRGEYPRSRTAMSDRRGSSPLSRGILHLELDTAPRTRIIPALAGNTEPAWTSRGRSADHPRSRGEYSPFAV